MACACAVAMLAACSPRIVEVAPSTTLAEMAPANPGLTDPETTADTVVSPDPVPPSVGSDAAANAGRGVDRQGDPPEAIEVSPNQDVVALVAESPEGSYFRFLPGEYRGVVIEPKDGMTFVADDGVVLTGAVGVEGFTAEDGTWSVVSPVAARSEPVEGEEWGFCDEGREACVYPEDLFIDGTQLVRMATEDDVTAGRWFLDPATGRLVIGDDPAGRSVELSHYPHAFHGQADSITIAGFEIEKYATPGRQGAINPRVGRVQGAGVDWTVADNAIRWSHGWGVKLEDGMEVSGNVLEFNGQGGIGGVATNVVITNNRVAGNCVAGYRCFGWEGGGMKLHVEDAVVSGNTVEGNLGHGIHTDRWCQRVRVESNLVTDNQGAGIHHEISGSAVISGNVVTGNGFAPDRPQEPGILVLSSSDTQVLDNTVEENALGIVLRQDERVQDGILRDVVVRSNAVTTESGPAVVFGGSPGTGFVGEWGTNLVFEANRYVFSEAVETAFRWEGRPVTVEEWKSFGNDLEGSFTITS